MSSAFPCYSTSTPNTYYRISSKDNNTRSVPMDNESIVRRHSNHIPRQKIHRKPVPLLEVTSEVKDYAETMSPNGIQAYNQITPIQSEKKREKPFQDLNVTPPSPVEKNMSTTLIPTFWYPRTGKENEPLKRNISKKIRELLQPHRMQLEEASKSQHQTDYSVSLCRSRTPRFKQKNDPFRILRHTGTDETELQFQESDFAQIDTYASTVQQRGPFLTPTILSQKFLVRPYRRELFRLRALFIWIVQNIRPEYHQRRSDLLLLQRQQAYVLQYYNQKQSEKSSVLKQKLRRMSHSVEEGNETLLNKLDAIDLLQEEAVVLSAHVNELPEQVLEKRMCKSAFGMAHLFANMAIAAGFENTQVVYGYLKAPKDTIDIAEQSLPINHAWCAVQIEGEYRFIDCWLSSPFHPHNENKIEPHWFLTLPLDMVMTHLPEQRKDQHLSPSITHHEFFNLPYVRNAFFWHRIEVLQYITHQSKESIIYMSMNVQPGISCYAEIEAEGGSVARGLAQCLNDDEYRRVCKIKAVLPSGHTKGWLKIYTGLKATPSSVTPLHQEVIHKGHYTLAMCIKVTADQPSSRFDFVKLHADHNDFYIQEPQLYQLYPLQTYQFIIKGSRLDYKATHHKLAIKSPNGKLHKLMYQPQDQIYEVTVKVSEAGKWSLICLLHHTGGWYTIAEWSCSISEY